MTRIVIAGAGGFGRGVYSWITSSPGHLEKFDVQDVVYVDDVVPVAPHRAKVIGDIQNYEPKATDRVLCAIGSPAIRRRVVQVLKARSAQFHTFVDDRAVLASGVEVGTGAIICPGVVISDKVRIGAHVHINFNSSVGHDSVINDFCTLSPMVNVMGGVQVGHGAFFGGSCTILPRICIGPNAVIGAGSVAVRSVAEGHTMVGNPARSLKGTGTP